MQKHLILLAILMITSSTIRAQKVSRVDSIAIMKEMDSLFYQFEHPDFKTFKQISTDKLYCIMCHKRSGMIRRKYMFDRKTFFNSHMTAIIQSDMFIRARQSKDVLLVKENFLLTDFTVFLTVYKQDERFPGDEGEQLGFYFKEVNGAYKFAGLDTIP